jgi:hypothetical protein
LVEIFYASLNTGIGLELQAAHFSQVRYSLPELCQICLLEFILVEGDAKSMKHFKGGARRKSLGTCYIAWNEMMTDE